MAPRAVRSNAKTRLAKVRVPATPQDVRSRKTGDCHRRPKTETATLTETDMGGGSPVPIFQPTQPALCFRAATVRESAWPPSRPPKPIKTRRTIHVESTAYGASSTESGLSSARPSPRAKDPTPTRTPPSPPNTLRRQSNTPYPEPRLRSLTPPKTPKIATPANPRSQNFQKYLHYSQLTLPKRHHPHFHPSHPPHLRPDSKTPS